MQMDPQSQLVDYPDSSFFETLDLSDYERTFANTEYGRGLEYYLARLDRLMLHGRRVLDAGCGVGQWSVALSYRYNEVDAIDVNQTRIETFRKVRDSLCTKDKISIHQASVIDTPFLDESFDAIFCYGVIMFTPIESTLREFFRVLKPGGRVYVCLNGDGWFQYVRDTREDPVVVQYMKHILARTAVERITATSVLDDCSLLDRAAVRQARNEEHTREKNMIHQAYMDLSCLLEGPVPGQISLFPDTTYTYMDWAKRADPPFAYLAEGLCADMQRRTGLSALSKRSSDRYGPAGPLGLARMIVCQLLLFGRLPEFEDFYALVQRLCYEKPDSFEWHEEDLEVFQCLSWIYEVQRERISDPTRAYSFEELASLIDRQGFADFQPAYEGHLVCDVRVPAVEPIYEGLYNGYLCVWEAIFLRPNNDPRVMSPEDHVRECDLRRKQSLCLLASNGAVISNTSRQTLPSEYLQLARHKADALDGVKHLAYIADRLCSEGGTEEQHFARIVEFVQRSIFRDPISQPLEGDGSMLDDPCVILMSHTGRCGHVAALLVKLFSLVGIRAEIVQLPRHVSVRALVGGRWLVADADTFKNGIVLRNEEGSLLSFEDIERNPFLLDRYPPTGWCYLPGTRYAKDSLGRVVSGYVELLPFEQRGFASGYYNERAAGFPPSLPVITRFDVHNGRCQLEWVPSVAPSDDLLGYRVRIGTRSRCWTYNNLGDHDEILQATCDDVSSTQTSDCHIDAELAMKRPGKLYASVTAINNRVELERETFFWPSEEASCEVPSDR